MSAEIEIATPVVSTCGSCYAPIWWATSRVGGKRIPMDDKPTPNGNLYVWGCTDQGRPVVDYIGKGDRVATVRYTSHFATCPNADRHRRPKA